jgi:hypothetical protein
MKYKYEKYDYTGIITPCEFTLNLPYDYIIRSCYLNGKDELVLEVDMVKGIEKISMDIKCLIENE